MKFENQEEKTLPPLGRSSSKSRPVVVLLKQGSVFNLQGFVHFPAGLQLDNCSVEKWLIRREDGGVYSVPLFRRLKQFFDRNYIGRAISSAPATATSKKEDESGPGSVKKSIRSKELNYSLPE